MNEVEEIRERDTLLDDLEVALLQLPRVEIPITHRFTEGMYIREMRIPAGTMLTSMTHKTEHPFVISEGAIKISSDHEGSVILEAPYTGVTKPNTRRAGHALTDVVWTTFHATTETDVEKICEEILEPNNHAHLQLEGKKFIPQYKESLLE